MIGALITVAKALAVCFEPVSDPLFARFGREFQAGDVLFREGESGDVMYVIQSGAVRITKDVTVTYSTNIASDPNQVLTVEYRVSNRMSFVAQYEQGSNRNLATRNNNYSFEIRFRKRF